MSAMTARPLRYALVGDGESPHLLKWARALAPVMLDRYPQHAERHVARWLGGKADYLKA